MRILFYKPQLNWPHASGHDVHTYHMMRAMADLGVRVTLAMPRAPSSEALAGIALEHFVELNHAGASSDPNPEVALKPFEERFRSYWGIPRKRIAAFGRLAEELSADAVVVSGLDVLPLLGDITGRVRVWYACDEWVWHHLSQVQIADVRSWQNVKAAAVKGMYERVFSARVDRAWAVSEPDRWSLRWIAGMRNVDTIPNGVDADRYRPCKGNEEPDTAIFWGRLDFGPNIQALEWFVTHVWPLVRAARPTANFTIVGFHPEPLVRKLTEIEGVVLRPDLPDIRPEVARHAVVALPFVSGGGIKNKLLEAAAMGKAIVATPRSLLGLRGNPPIQLAQTPRQWATTICRLWEDERTRHELGARARDWVVTEHTWSAAARLALDAIESSFIQERK